ncbi:MAG: PIG-L family deacetylase [Gemmatimonadetes bacterium]|nr:PIG-L family deacetylase [Gemmatimonadota bacterium]
MTSENPDPPYTRAMVVVAHPDDAEYGCSGTVAKWCRQGWEVVQVICTDGSKGSSDPDATIEQVAATRRAEQLEAARILGVKHVEFLNYPDSFLTPSLELRKDIARAIRKHRPDVLVCANPNRDLDQSYYIGHPDHQAAAEAALSAAFPAARDRLTYPDMLEEGLLPHKVREVWVMMGPDRSNHFNEVSEEDLETAVRALQAHASQVPPDAAERVREWKRRSGEKAGLRYAEAFRVFRLR